MVPRGTRGSQGIEMTRGGLLLAVVTATLLASGCIGPGPGDDSPSPSWWSSIEPSAAVPRTVAPSRSPAPSAAPPSASASVPPAGDLEDLLPDYVGADYVDKRQLTGAELFDQSDPPIFERMLGSVGAGPEAVEGALGTSSHVGLVILRVTGVSGADLGDALVDAARGEVPGTTVADYLVDGDSLRRLVFDDRATEDRLTILAVGDKLILAFADQAQDSLVDEVLTTMFDPKLEALLPAVLDGRPLQRFSIPGIAFPQGGDMCTIVCPGEPQRLAAELGVDISGVDLAVAGTDVEPGISIVAMRFEGAATEGLVPARKATTSKDLATEWTEHTIAGRTAWRYRDVIPGASSYDEWLYAKDDVLYVIRALTVEQDVPRIVELAIAALP
jgi:hypothetical protein